MKNYIQTLSVLLVLVTFLFASCNDENEEIVVRPTNGLVANAGEDKTISVNAELTFDGSRSFDKNGKPFRYEWTFKSKPAGSSAVLRSPTSAKTVFMPDVPGIYVLQLAISQDEWSAKDEVILVATSGNEPNESTIILSDDINENRVLNDIVDDPSLPDYLVTSVIDVRGELVIMPGVTVHFQENTGLKILSGKFISVGTTGEPVTFRGVEERTGYWKGIIIYPNDSENSIANTIIRHAGSEAFPETVTRAAITLAGTPISGASLQMSNTSVESSSGHGLQVQGGSTLRLFENNSFVNNLGAVYIPAAQLGNVGEGNSFSGNNFNGIETGGDVILEDAIWPDLSPYSYFVTSDITIRTGVTISGGAKFGMAGGVAIKVKDHGYLNADGSEARKIIFTAANQSHRWAGLYVNTQSPNNRLIHTEVSYAGHATLEDVVEPANVGIGNGGQLYLENSFISNGAGYGLVAKYYYQVNENMALVNHFSSHTKGYVLPRSLLYPDRPSLNGDWVDMWSHMQGIHEVAQDYYSPSTGIWFGGAVDPWQQESGGMGIHFTEDGKFIWAIGEHSPMTGCPSFSAEFITGDITVTEETITFHQDYWRSKFLNECDPSQNVDMEITPSDIVLKYEYDKLFNMLTGEVVWVLKFTNPDGSSFSFYRP